MSIHVIKTQSDALLMLLLIFWVSTCLLDGGLIFGLSVLSGEATLEHVSLVEGGGGECSSMVDLSLAN